MANKQSKVKVSGPSNTNTKKQYQKQFEGPANKTNPSQVASAPNRKGAYAGQIGHFNEDFADPMNKGAPAYIRGMEGLHNDIGESSGFITDGYMDKGNTPVGEAAKFNFLPPGMDISNQENASINEMPMRKIVAESYPGDGWMPAPEDIPE